MLEGQNEEVKARVDQMALVLRDGEADPTEELTKLFSDESLSDNDRQSILDVVTAQSRLATIERSHQEAKAQMQNELTKEWSAKSVVGDETARGAVISATITDVDGKPKQVYVTGGVRVVTNEDGTVELLPTDDDAPIYVYDESVEGDEKGHIVQMDDLSSPQLVAEDYLDLVQASIDEAETAFRSEVQAAEEQLSQKDAEDAGDATDDFMQSLPRTREGEVDGLKLMSERPDDFIRYLGQLYGEDFVASLPLSKSGTLDLKALTPEQTLKVNEAALGKSGAVEAARQRRSKVGAERSKLESEVKSDLGNLEKRMALRKASEEYRLYDDYVRAAEGQARQELEAQKRSEEEALTPEERQRREEEKRQLAQEKKEREERIRLENERRRREREELERNAEGSTVREYTEDPPRQARARGARLVNGAVVYRQEPMTVEHYADAERAFSQRPGETRIPVKRTIVEAESLQASHKEGRMNPRHFIPEAQPKDRADNGLSSTAADRIASNIRPDEITGGITAYTGAPVVNGRGEVIQGNNRTDALQTMYDGEERHAKSAELYKEYLKAHASEYGMTAEQVDAMAHPVAVDVAEVSDSEAIRLGHRGQTDLESAGADTMNAQTVGEELNSDTDPQSGQSMLVSFFNRIFNRTGANGAELSAKMDNMLNRNAEEGLKFLHENGYITDTQYKNAFETNSEGKRVVTAEAKTALKDVALYQLADVIGPRATDIFYRLPASARNGLATFLYRDSQASFETSLAPDLGDALLVWDSLRQDPDFAGQTNFESAKIFILGKVSLFGRSELETNLGEASSLAKLLAASMQTQTEEQIAGALNKYYDLVGANETGTKTQSLMPTSQPTDTKAGAAEAVYGRVYEVPSGREKHYRFRRDVAEDFRARRDALADRITEERRKRAAAMDMSRTFGVPMKLHEDMSTLPEEVRAGFDETHFVKGWFYKGDNAVHIYLPANVDADDVRATFLHEAVGHYGCRELLGEVGYNQVLDGIANKLGEEEVLRAMNEYCNGSQDLTNRGQVRIAMDEWIAHRAESGITKKTVWESIKDFFRNVFGLSGKQIDQSAEMMADDLLRRSAENLQKRAERQQGVASEGSTEQAEVRFREGDSVDNERQKGLQDNQGNPIDRQGSLLLDHIEEPAYLTDEDFRNPSRNVSLRELPSAVDSAVGGEGKPVVIKKNIFEKNKRSHPDLTPEDGRQIIESALYRPTFYGQNRKISRPDNWIIIHKEGINSSVVIEVSKMKDAIEVVNWHYVDDRGIEKIKRQSEREGGQLLILPLETTVPKEDGALSIRTLGSSLQDKGKYNSQKEQLENDETRFRRAESAGDVSGAAEAASDFMRNATPKNTTVDDVLRFLRVYHNSPHLLKKADGAFVDPETGERLGFDHRFMGSGEGAQSHGWGSYFGVKDLDWYAPRQDLLAPDGFKFIRNSHYVTSHKGTTDTSYILFNLVRRAYNDGLRAEKEVRESVADRIKTLRQKREIIEKRSLRLLEAIKKKEAWALSLSKLDKGEPIVDNKTGYTYVATFFPEEEAKTHYDSSRKAIKQYDDALTFISDNPDFIPYFVTESNESGRHKYIVEIPDPSAFEYIQERKHLSDKTKELVLQAMKEDPLPTGDISEHTLSSVNGKAFYDLLRKAFETEGRSTPDNYNKAKQAASEWLSRAGIVGIHYYGRIDGECYVIFNDKDAKITDHIRFRREEREKIRKDAIADGTWMKAPNGENSNLSEMDWVTVRTKAFKDWFGDWADRNSSHSLIVDSNGEPLPVYHYTSEDFTVFDRSKARKATDVDGFFFAPSHEDWSAMGDKLITAFLNIRRPAINPVLALGQTYDAGVKERLRLEREGYDGIINGDSEEGIEYVAFYPNQIKRTDGEAFSPNSDDIRFRRKKAHLAGVHTLTTDNLRHALKVGGLANPSLAVYDTERGLSTRTFGEVALIAPRDLVDANTGRHKGTYNRDSWSPVYPRIAYDLTEKGHDLMRELDKKRGEREGSLYALHNLVMEEPKILDKDYFIKLLSVDQQIKELYRSEAPSIPFDQYVEKIAEPILKERREMLYAGQNPDGSKRYVPHTLENVSKVMNEDFSKIAPWDLFMESLVDLSEKYKSLESIRRHEDRIAGMDDSLYKKVENEFHNLAEELVSDKTVTMYPAEPAKKLQALIVNNDNRYGRPLTVTEEARVSALREQMKSLPTDYFETKVDRPVGLDEFVEAVVPEGTSPELVSELEKSGLKVSTYDSTKEGAMNEAVLSAIDRADATDRGVRFRTGEQNIEDMTTATGGGLSEALRYVRDKKKALDWLGIAPPKGASAQADPKLSDIANITNGFENPKVDKATPPDPKLRFRMAERAGDVSGAAEAASDFMRNTTPKNTTVDDVLRFCRVYHNSPHLLKKADGTFVDPETGERLGFDHRFMGSGEGFQAHGWGSYFSVNDLEGYASPNDEVYDGIRLTQNDAYVTSRGGSTNIASILFQTIRTCWIRNGSIASEKAVKKGVGETLGRIYQKYEQIAREEERLLEALKDNEPWAVTLTSSERESTVTDPKTGYEYAPRTFSVEEEKRTYKYAQRQADRYKAALLFTESNPDYVRHFETKVTRHKYTVEIPDPDTNHYIKEDRRVTKREGEMIRTEINNNPEIKNRVLADESWRGRKWVEAYELLSRRLGGEDRASSLLNKAGFVGIHYNGHIDGECYVIFNENDAKITEHVRFRRTSNAERLEIERKAKADGSWLLAPDGTPTTLSEDGWVASRSSDFRAEYGDWSNPEVRERSRRIDKLLKSDPIVIPQEGVIDLSHRDRKEIRQWAKENLKRSYTNRDTGDTITISTRGIKEASHHGMNDNAHKMTFAYIPQMIENSIFLYEDHRQHEGAPYAMYRYYVAGMNINGEDYTVRLSVGVDENGRRYYDHGLTQIEKKKLVDFVNQPAKSFTAIEGIPEAAPQLSSAQGKGTKSSVSNKQMPVTHVGQPAESFISMGAEPSVVPDPSVASLKDKRLVEILQGYLPESFYQANGEPKREIVEEYLRAEDEKEIRYRRVKADPMNAISPINPQWDGEWYSPEDLTGKSTADLLELPAAPATPEKRPTQSVASYAETMSRHYADPRVRFRTGAHTENLRAPQPPRITDGMSLYEVAQLQHEYNRNYRDFSEESMRRMGALDKYPEKFIRSQIDVARPVELFVEEMKRLGLEVSPDVVGQIAIFAKISLEPTLL